MKNDLVDQWLADPKGCQFEDDAILPALSSLEKKLTDAWDNGREAEREALLTLREVLLAYQEQEVDREMDFRLRYQAGASRWTTSVSHWGTHGRARLHPHRFPED